MTTISKEIWLQGQLLGRAASWVQANVYLCYIGGQKSVIKDYGDAPLLFRHTVCRWILNREIKALTRLAHSGVTTLFCGRCDTFAYAMTYVEGQPFKFSRHIRSRDDIAALQATVNRMHAAGVVHNDLHGRNIIVTEAGQFILIDFASAFCKSDNSGLLAWVNNQCFRFFEMLDNAKIARMKVKLNPAYIDESDQHYLHIKKIASLLTQAWKKLINEPLLRKRTWQKRKERLQRWLSR